MRIKYDKMADAMYIYMKKSKVAKTIKVNSRLLVDVDKNNDLVGIEMLGVSKQIPKAQIGKVSTEMPVYA